MKPSPLPIALAGGVRLLVDLLFAARDPVREAGVDDDGEDLRLVLADERLHGFVELGEARQVASLGRDVRPIDDHMLELLTRHAARIQPDLPPCGADYT